MNEPEVNKPEDQETLEIKPYIAGELPPRGTVLARVTVEDKDGVRRQLTGWVKAKDLPEGQRPRLSKLNNDQCHRSNSIFRKIGKYVRHVKTEDAWARGFEEDADPEIQIALWEKLTRVFLRERSVRPKTEHALLFGALVAIISGTSSLDHLLSRVPQLKALRGLDRIVDEFRKDTPAPPAAPEGAPPA